MTFRMRALICVVVFSVASAAHAQAVEESASAATAREARRQVYELLKEQFGFDREGGAITAVEIRTEYLRLWIKGRSQPRLYAFKDMPPLKVESPWHDSAYRVFISQRDYVYSLDRPRAERLVQGLQRLRIESANVSDPAAEAAFAEVVSRYRGAGQKVEFPENARRLRVQAEAMLRDKRFEEAADLYEDALRVAPWWPEGRFNRALILGEIKEYTRAVQEMKRYLLLVPEAENARAAKDKIYEWEAKEAKAK